MFSGLPREDTATCLQRLLIKVNGEIAGLVEYRLTLVEALAEVKSRRRPPRRKTSNT